MSDNLPPEVVQHELEARLRIPTEVWTDIFKLLPRRVLVQQIAPTCYRFKEISDKNTKNVHVIENAEEFTDKLDEDDPEAIEELEHLAGNDCNLAGQFRLAKIWINEKGQAILRHCPDLFNCCKIVLRFGEKNKSSSMFLECLSELEKAKPIAIEVIQQADQLFDFWHHPTFLNSTRVHLDFWPFIPADAMRSAFENIFNWLHHRLIGMDCDASVDELVRCMTVWFSYPDNIDWLINRCSNNIQQSKQPIDCRPYVLSFGCLGWPGFDQFRRIENKSTGEVLVLEQKVLANGQATHRYRLRRCLVEEEANGAEFYKGMFEQDYEVDVFNIGDETPEVVIK